MELEVCIGVFGSCAGSTACFRSFAYVSLMIRDHGVGSEVCKCFLVACVGITVCFQSFINISLMRASELRRVRICVCVRVYLCVPEKS